MYTPQSGSVYQYSAQNTQLVLKSTQSLIWKENIIELSRKSSPYADHHQTQVWTEKEEEESNTLDIKKDIDRKMMF